MEIGYWSVIPQSVKCSLKCTGIQVNRSSTLKLPLIRVCCPKGYVTCRHKSTMRSAVGSWDLELLDVAAPLRALAGKKLPSDCSLRQAHGRWLLAFPYPTLKCLSLPLQPLDFWPAPHRRHLRPRVRYGRGTWLQAARQRHGPPVLAQLQVPPGHCC